MFRTALCTMLATVGLATAAPPTSFPQIATSYHPSHRRGHYPPPIGIPPFYRTYKVLYRTCDHEPWRVYTVTRNHDRAHDLVRHLRHHGYEARVLHG